VIGRRSPKRSHRKPSTATSTGGPGLVPWWPHTPPSARNPLPFPTSIHPALLVFITSPEHRIIARAERHSPLPFFPGELPIDRAGVDNGLTRDDAASCISKPQQHLESHSTATSTRRVQHNLTNTPPPTLAPFSTRFPCYPQAILAIQRFPMPCAWYNIFERTTTPL
jgi:hypothetical protein